VTLLFLLVFAGVCNGQHQFQRSVTWEDNRYNTLPVTYASTTSQPPAISLKRFYPRVVIEPKMDFTGIAWGMVWNARTAAEAIACNQSEPAKILQMAFAPAYNYALVRKGSNCKEAVSMIDILESMTKNGCLYFSEFREFCAAEVTPDYFAQAKTKRLSGYFKLFNTNDTQQIKVASVKGALLSNNPVVVGMICPPSFQLAQEFWQPREQPDLLYGGHAINIVGYDDTKFGGAFEVINTWGKDWANQGSTWIRYKDFNDYARYGFSLYQIGSGACDVPYFGEVKITDLSGAIMSVVKGPEPGEFSLDRTYPSGTIFSITVDSNRPSFVYCFGVDPDNNYFPLFPRLATTKPITFNRIRVPDDQPAITLTDPPGRNYIYFIFSPTELDLAKTMSSLSKQRDVAPAQVTTALRSIPGQVIWNPQGSFTGTLNGPVVMRVTLDQTKK
jgi:hypothetical protein